MCEITDEHKLQQQNNCTQGKHEWVTIAKGAIDGVKWCRFCGTIKFLGGIVCPDYPHFLEKQRNRE